MMGLRSLLLAALFSAASIIPARAEENGCFPGIETTDRQDTIELERLTLQYDDPSLCTFSQQLSGSDLDLYSLLQEIYSIKWPSGFPGEYSQSSEETSFNPKYRGLGFTFGIALLNKTLYTSGAVSVPVNGYTLLVSYDKEWSPRIKEDDELSIKGVEIPGFGTSDINLKGTRKSRAHRVGMLFKYDPNSLRYLSQWVYVVPSIHVGGGVHLDTSEFRTGNGGKLPAPAEVDLFFGGGLELAVIFPFRAIGVVDRIPILRDIVVRAEILGQYHITNFINEQPDRDDHFFYFRPSLGFSYATE